MQQTTKGEKPLLLLDIDGVLNVLPLWGADKPEHLRRTKIRGYTIHLNPDHVDHVRKFEKHFDIMWSTMWQGTARTQFAPEAGYGHAWPHIPFDRHWNDLDLMREVLAQTRHLDGYATDEYGANRRSVGEYKHPGFVKAIGDRPAIIVDDDLEPWQHVWALERSNAGIPTLVIQPYPEEGLTTEDAEHILEFAALLSNDSVSTTEV